IGRTSVCAREGSGRSEGSGCGRPPTLRLRRQRRDNDLAHQVFLKERNGFGGGGMTSLTERATNKAQQMGWGSESRTMTVGDFLIRRLQEAGIGHLFGVPGDFNLELLQQL